MTAYAFLSDEWILAAKEIYARAAGREATGNNETQPSITMNLVMKNVPFRDDPVLAHVDSSDGIFRIDLGALDEAEVKLTLDYKIARSILLDGDAQVGMRAFLGGKIRVEGNMAKLLALRNSSSARDDVVMAELRAITLKED